VNFPGGGAGGRIPGIGQAPAGGGRLGGNKLKERFLADAHFKKLYLAEYWKLYDALFASGAAANELARLEGVLVTGALSLVDAATVKSEADRVRATLDARTKALATQR